MSIAAAPAIAGLKPSARVRSLKPSVTVAFMNRAKAMKASGLDVIAFAAGEPDFDTPQAIKDAAIKAMQAGVTKYMPTLGDQASRQAVADKLTRENGIPGLTANHTAISAGGKHSLFIAMQCLLDDPRLVAGTPDELAGPQDVLLPVPAWVSYAPIAEMAGGRVVELPTSASDDFKISPEQLSRAITPRSRVLIINSPSNPCGTMYTPDELRALARVVADKAARVAPNLVVLSDEIYEKIVYGGIEHFSIGSVPDIAERTITINGMSKAFAMTGWRIGYAAMPGPFGKQLIEAMGTLQGQMTTNITSFNYAAVKEALTNPSIAGEIEKMRVAFARRGELIYKRLSAIPGVRCPRPTGAFYAFPDISGLFGKTSPKGKRITSANDLAEVLLDEALLAFVPGEDFGGCAVNHVRLSFACSEEQITKGMDRFEAFVATLR